MGKERPDIKQLVDDLLDISYAFDGVRDERWECEYCGEMNEPSNSYCHGCEDMYLDLDTNEFLTARDQRREGMGMDSTMVVEVASLVFYRKFGVLAPGKDVPAAYCSGYPTDEKRREMFDKFLDECRDTIVDTLWSAIDLGFINDE